jgi:hypothetical protein
MTEFIQRIPSPPVFTGDEQQHLQAVLDDLDGVFLDSIEDEILRDQIREERANDGLCCECGGELRFHRGERRTYDHPGSEECVACDDCGEVAA